MRALRPLTSRSTYRGWMWLVLGGALLMPYMMAGAVVKLVAGGQASPADPLITVQLPVFAATLPVIAVTGLVLPVRILSSLTARTLLDVNVPPATRRRDWSRRTRDAAWFTLHLGVGGLVSGITLAVVPFAFFIATLPLLSNQGELVSRYFALEWQPWWGVILGPVSLVALIYLAWAATVLLRRAAGRLLGPTDAEKLSESRARAANLAARNHIARELHDSIGHALSVVTVQSAAAGRVLTTDPDFTRQALSAIEDTARRALEELDTVLG
ncbi:MAG: histidine kinase dimerization/phosphoacceptor domain-containing protein, partial [Stackebrandtia sp.]